MSKFINADTLCQRLENRIRFAQEILDSEVASEYEKLAAYHSIEQLNAVLAADVEPVRHGHWIDINYKGIPHKKCNKCFAMIEDTFFSYDFNVDYCPSCGAKMDGDK